jgi:tRNA(fMet)-specific endonuclease VapC
VYLSDEKSAGTCYRAVRAMLRGRGGDVSITFAELSYGVSVSADPKREAKNLSSLVEDIPLAPFDQAAGAVYGPIRLATSESKKDHLDKLIAAHSKALSVTLVTNNLRDFERYPGVKAENWLI